MSDKITVIKFGGSTIKNKAELLQNIAFLHSGRGKIILVHGGGPEINTLLAATGKKPEFVNGLRKTDSETIDIVMMALCGKINKLLSAELFRFGVQSLGISGLDCAILRARRTSNTELGFVGNVSAVNADVLNRILQAGFLPVIAPLALEEGVHGVILNVNADLAAAEIARFMKAENFILITDVPGVLKDVNDKSSLIHEISTAELDDLKNSGVIKGGMLPKVECVQKAVSGGVEKAFIIDGGRAENLLLAASGKPCGTCIYGE